MPQLYWDTIDLGDPVAPLSKPAISRVQIAKFAGAAQDWSPLHIDDDFAKSAGYGSVFAHGAMSLGFAVEAVQKWLENGRVLASSATFQKLVWPGDILTAKGVVVNRYEKAGEPRVDIDVWAENQNHDIVMKGQVTCLLWRNDKDEKKAKGSWPPVSPETIKERRTAKPVPRSEVDAQKARLEAAQQQAQQAQHAAENRKGKPSPRPPASTPPPAPRAPAPPPAKAPPAAPPVRGPTSTSSKPAAVAPTKAPPAKAAPVQAAPAKPTPSKAPPAKPAPSKAPPAKPAPSKAPPAKPAPSKAAPAKPEKKAEKKPEKKAEKKPEKKAEKKPEKKDNKKDKKKK
jgi:acyl dehydratase